MQGINAQKTTMPTGSKTKQSSRGINHQEQTHRCQEQSHSQDWRNRLFVRVPLSMPVYFFISLSEVKMWGAGVQDGVFQEMQQWQSDTSSDGTLKHRALLVLVSEMASPSVHQDKTGGGDYGLTHENLSRCRRSSRYCSPKVHEYCIFRHGSMINKNDEYYYIEKENSSKKSRLKHVCAKFF